MAPRPNTIDDVFRKVVRGEDCWAWTGSHSAKGYAVVSLRGRTRKVHRVMYEHFVGPVPDDAHLDHLCRNRGCVNPAHLEVVTPRTNIVRGWDARRPDRDRICPNGHIGEMNRVKTTGALYCRACRRDIQRRWREGKSHGTAHLED